MSRAKSNEQGWRQWEAKRMVCFRSGKDLKAWRVKLGLQMIEVAALLGMHQTTISNAEKSKHLSAGLKRAVGLLQEAIKTGEIDIEGIKANRKRRGRPLK
jgi:transcriptional regulator with XRE-family HTH domain